MKLSKHHCKMAVLSFCRISTSLIKFPISPGSEFQRGLWHIPMPKKFPILRFYITRFVHAKGTGAKGYFKVEHGGKEPSFKPSDFSDAKFLQEGTQTDLFARFSTVAGERGSADSVRDNRGFAFKLYTAEGNLDWLFFNPVKSVGCSYICAHLLTPSC